MSYGSMNSLRKSFNGTSPPVKKSLIGKGGRGSPRNTLNGTSSSSKAIMSKHMNKYEADLKKHQDQHSFANDKNIHESTIFVENSFSETKEMTSENIEIDNLKTIIIALKQKLTSQEDTQLELQQLYIDFHNSERQREELRNQLALQTQQMNSQQQKSSKLQELVIAENQNWNLMDQEKEKIIAEKNQIVNELQQKILNLERENTLLKSEAKNAKVASQDSTNN